MRNLLLAAILTSAIAITGCGGTDDVTDAGVPAGDAGIPGLEPADAGADAGPETCVPLAERFEQDTTLPRGCYLAQKEPIIAAAVTLTLQPGVKIVFAPDTRLTISADQVLIAEGTAADPILFTSATQQRGAWEGLSFEGTSTPSRLDYVTVEYAGNTRVDRDSAAIKAIADSRGVRLSIKHSTLRQSQGWGMWLASSAVVSGFEANSLTENTLGPVNMDSETVGVLDAASTYKGNDVDRIFVRANRIQNAAATWSKLDVPYYVDSSLTAYAEWTVAAGVTMVMAKDAHIGISGPDAALIAKGTETEPILFTGETKQRGFWRGIGFDLATNPKNELTWATVEYGGGIGADANNAAVKLTADSRGVSLIMTHTTLKESQGWGLWLTGTAKLPQFTANTLTANTLGPASVDAETVRFLDPTSTFTGNDKDELRVRAYQLSTAATWNDLGVPYFLQSKLSNSKVDWTIAPGVTLIMADGTALDISSDAGALIAAGTAAKPITFTAATKQRGAWDGITFGGSNNTRNVLDYVKVEYAGDTTSDADAAAVKLTADSHGVQVKITNSTLIDSEGYGLYLTGSAVVPGFTGNVVTRNAKGPAYVFTPSAHLLLTTNTYTGNDVDRVHVNSYSVPGTVTWGDIGVPYVIYGQIRVDGVWTLEPGVRLIMREGAWISVGGDDSGFHAVGTAAKPIVITGDEPTKGYWDGITFDGSLNGANAIDHCTVEYGGGGNYSGMISAISDSHGVTVSVTNSVIQHSAKRGVYAGHYANVSVSGNTYADNTSGDYFHEP